MNKSILCLVLSLGLLVSSCGKESKTSDPSNPQAKALFDRVGSNQVDLNSIYGLWHGYFGGGTNTSLDARLLFGQNSMSLAIHCTIYNNGVPLYLYSMVTSPARITADGIGGYEITTLQDVSETIVSGDNKCSSKISVQTVKVWINRLGGLVFGDLSLTKISD